MEEFLSPSAQSVQRSWTMLFLPRGREIIKQRYGEAFNDDLYKGGVQLLLAMKSVEGRMKKLVDDGVFEEWGNKVCIYRYIFSIILVVPVHSFFNESGKFKDGDTESEDIQN
jgi:hypothetical protein